MKRPAPWVWSILLEIAVVATLLAICAAVVHGQACATGPCPNGQCGVNLGIGLGLGAGAWRSPRIQPAQPGPQQVAAPAPAQAVKITNATGRLRAHGTGAFVAWASTAVVLTCHHMFDEGAGNITVTTGNGTELPAKLIGADPGEDLAALSVASCSAQPLRVATEYPRQGETVSGGGFGGNGQWVWIMGACRGFVAQDRQSRKATSFTFAGAARQGDSGGPVLNQRGELVGVLWGTDGREVAATYCGSIAKFLASLPSEKPPASVGRGLPLPGSAPGAAPPCDCSPVVAKIEAMAKAWDEHRAAADKRMEAVAAAVMRHGLAMNEQAAGAAELQQAVKAIPDQITAVKAAVESQKGTIQSQAQIVNQVQQTVAAMPDAIGTAAAASGRTALWTALCGALGVGGPAGIGLAIGLRLLGRAIDRRRQAAETTQQPAATTQRPAEPIVDRQIITAPVPTAHERALQAAVDLYSQRYPGGGALIQSYVSQFESGNLGALK